MALGVSTFPNELWLSILTFPVLRRPDHISISLTCHHIRSLILPMLFEHLHLRPYAVDGSEETPPTIATEAKLDAELARLAFWASDKIASSVRRCTLAGWWHSQRPQYRVAEDPYILQTAFLRAAGRFTHLKTLVATKIFFRSADLHALASLTSIESFSVSLFRFAGDLVFPRNSWSLQSITISPVYCAAYGVEQESRMLATWFRLVNPAVLQRIALPEGPPYVRIDEANDPIVFPEVHTLSTVCDGSAMDFHRFEALLAMVPNLRHLEVGPGAFIWPDLAADEHSFSEAFPRCLSSLRELSIPVGLLSAFRTISSNGHGIQRLSIQRECSTARLLSLLTVGSPYVNVVDLEIENLDEDGDDLVRGVADLREILTRLDRLERVKVKAYYPPPITPLAATTCINTLLSLPASLPVGLKFFALTIKMHAPSVLREALPLPAAIDPPATVTTLRRRCPALEFVWIDALHFLIDWRVPGPGLRRVAGRRVRSSQSGQGLDTLPGNEDCQWAANFEVLDPYEPGQNIDQLAKLWQELTPAWEARSQNHDSDLD
uniref:F-box domain-containing protein n=1 Tax=Mycena chlorophos TaxID=658473 RepID=A0ABQ0LV35_MYCCL|nr:predicted protein [Mycena chlorophos]